MPKLPIDDVNDVNVANIVSCAKLLYAFLWQVSADIFNAEDDMFDAKLFQKLSAGRCGRPGGSQPDTFSMLMLILT